MGQEVRKSLARYLSAFGLLWLTSILQSLRLINNRDAILTAPKARSPISRHWPSRGVGRSHCLEDSLFSVTSLAQMAKHLAGVSCRNTLISFMRILPAWPYHLPKTQALMPSFWGLGFQHRNVGETWISSPWHSGTMAKSPLQWNGDWSWGWRAPEQLPACKHLPFPVPLPHPSPSSLFSLGDSFLSVLGEFLVFSYNVVASGQWKCSPAAKDFKRQYCDLQSESCIAFMANFKGTQFPWNHAMEKSSETVHFQGKLT